MTSPCVESRLKVGMWAASGAVGLFLSVAAGAADRPAPLPLLSAASGAKPNVMLAMESHNAMSDPFTLTYKIINDSKADFAKKPYCKGGDWQTPPLPGYGAGWAGSAGKCAERYYWYVWPKTYSATRLSSPPAEDWRIPIDDNSPWHAMRSADVNPMFYNPRLTYKPRILPTANGVKVKNDAVDQVGNATLAGDALMNDTLFVSNQETANHHYCSDNNPGSDQYIQSWRSTAGMPDWKSTIGCSLASGFGGAHTPQLWETADRGIVKVPRYSTTTAPAANTAAFTYAYCAQALLNDNKIDGQPWLQSTGCRVGDLLHPRNDFSNGVPNVVQVKFGGPDIPLADGSAKYNYTRHQRTDCAGGLNATSCTWQEEMRNIANWYRWYSTQGAAISTALGRVLASPDYQDKFRVGYHRSYNLSSPIGNEMLRGNPNTIAIGTSAGRASSSLPAVRGVRLLSQKPEHQADSAQLFDWLYRWMAKSNGRERAPNNSLQAVANYYEVSSGHLENPWAADPSALHSAGNPELSCRRSFTLMIAALGGVTYELDTAQADKAYDRMNAAAFPSTQYGPNFNFKGYSPNGDDSNELTRKFYTPFGNHNYEPLLGNNNDNQRLRLSKKTAQYYWHKDFRPQLANDVPVRNGQPVAWQNITTYTLGYHMLPSLEMPNGTGRGLSYQQIESFKRDWLLNGSASLTNQRRPQWPARDATEAVKDGRNAVGLMANPRGIADDFIQAGYAGGGAGFGVTTPADMERAFDAILSEIINYRGRDAGVSMSGLSATANETLNGQVKYVAEYDLTNNSGVLTALQVNQFGQNSAELWNSSQSGLVPAVSQRVFFSRTQSGDTRELNQTHPLTQLGFSATELPVTGTSIDATKTNFVKYLLGDDTQADKNGGLWRQRNAVLAASVNTPPLYLRARLNMGYANPHADIIGKAGYADYFKNKFNRPGTLMLPSNQGLVHVFHAGDADKPFDGAVPGKELASYLLRGAAHKLPKFADPAYKFQYMADGLLTEHDFYDSNTNHWRNVVVGSLGRGGYGLYALESVIHATKPTPTKKEFLWERTAMDGAGYENLGHITNDTVSGINPEGVAMLVTTAGHYSSNNGKNGQAGLYVLKPNNGEVLKFIPTAGAGRGLGGVTLIRNAKMEVTGAYAGDAAGNVWRFILAGPTSNWGAKKIYSTGGLPIYAAPAWQTHPGQDGDTCQSESQSGACGAIVVFGTGILLDEEDQANTAEQRLIGIWDRTPVEALDFGLTAYSTGTNQLVEQSILLGDGLDGTSASVGQTFYPVSNHELDWKADRGWFIRLGQLPATTGERVIGDLMNVGGNVFAASAVIQAAEMNAEQCAKGPGGAPNVLYGVDALTGGLKRAFDQNGDGKLDAYGVAYVPAGGFTRGNALTQVLEPPPPSVGMLDYVLEHAGGSPREGRPQDPAQPPPGLPPAWLTGTESGILIGDGPEGPAGWRRSWRKVESLPPSLR